MRGTLEEMRLGVNLNNCVFISDSCYSVCERLLDGIRVDAVVSGPYVIDPKCLSIRKSLKLCAKLKNV